ncbi:MAG TPA: glycosyltransferase family 39 protein, partial [Candidatus Saccharimonadales bacterium]|nr:glycosyltransferase family 39 protein [Candidatus Saccharimonadales bacterium]
MSSSVTPKLKINTPVAAKLGVNLRHKLIIGLSLLVMTVLPVILSRMLFIDLSLRLDEAQSLFQTSHSLPRMLQLVAQDVHVPLYHLLLRGWQLAFGSGVEAIRYLSLVLFMAIIPLVYVLARHIFGWKQSLLAAGLVAISPFMNWYGNEARMYTLLALMTLINQIFFLRIIQRKAGAWWGYLFSAIVGIYSHYFFGFVLLTQAVFYLFRRKDFARGALLRFIGVALAVIAAISPWAYYVYSLGSASRTRPMLIHPTSVDLFNTFSQF